MNLLDLTDKQTSSVLLPSPEDYPFCFQRSYAQCLIEHKNWHLFLLASDSGAIVIPIALKKSYLWKVGQLLFPPLSEGQRLSPEAESIFLQDMLHYLEHQGLCDRLIQPPTWCVFSGYPDHSIVCPFGSYTLELLQTSEDAIFDRFRTNHKRNILKAERSGVQIRIGQDQLENFHAVYNETMARAAMGTENLAFLRDLMNAAPDHWCCAVSYNLNKPQSSSLVAHTRYGGFYIYGGSTKPMTPQGAHKLLIWHVIKYLKSRGVSRYDFVGARLTNIAGTKLEGLQKFKSGFSMDLKHGYLWKFNLRPVKASLYDLALWMHCRMNGRRNVNRIGDIIDQERQKLNALPNASVK